MKSTLASYSSSYKYIKKEISLPLRTHLLSQWLKGVMKFDECDEFHDTDTCCDRAASFNTSTHTVVTAHKQVIAASDTYWTHCEGFEAPTAIINPYEVVYSAI